MNEQSLQNKIRLAIAELGTFFRVNVGTGWTGLVNQRNGQLLTLKNYRTFTTGLPKGTSDIIGYTPVTITPDMVGQQVAIFTAIEVKTPKGKASPEQNLFLKLLNDAGGIGFIARSVDEALERLKHGE